MNDLFKREKYHYNFRFWVEVPFLDLATNLSEGSEPADLKR